MLLHLLDYLTTSVSGLASLEKITFRSSAAAVVGFFLAVWLGPRLIEWLQVRFREPNRSDSAEIRRLHEKKDATPTMGGLFLMAGLVAAVLVLGDLANPFVQAALVLVVGLAALGAMDDLTKLRGSSGGLSVKGKLAGQLVIAALVVLLVHTRLAATPDGLALSLPLVGTSIPLGLAWIPLAIIVIVGSSNAVNLTDGLDGLAGGCLIFAAGAMAVVTYACGHAELADYLHLPHVAGAGEMTVVAGAMIGGVLGFLWFNCHPAQVFMGDTGSLPLGGLLGFMAVVARQELLLLVIGGVFVAEAASVILQVGYYKWRRRRIFLCAPLHHHFQLRGWPETRVVTRFWIASAICAAVGLSTLKLGVREATSADPDAVHITQATDATW